MEAKQFRMSRLVETHMIMKRFGGNRRLYALDKNITETSKRKRQNELPINEVLQLLELHNQKFPDWFRVEDGTDEFCFEFLKRRNLKTSVSMTEYQEIPVLCNTGTDMKEILHSLLESGLEFDQLSVSCSYDFTTVDIPQKMVLMKHLDSREIIPECLKHQTRHFSPMTIENVIGANFEDKGRLVLVTSDVILHSRYLFRDFANVQFHDSVQNARAPMRVCFGSHSETDLLESF